MNSSKATISTDDLPVATLSKLNLVESIWESLACGEEVKEFSSYRQ